MNSRSGVAGAVARVGAILTAMGAMSLAVAGQDAPRRVEPTWLRREVAERKEHTTDLTTATCHYTAIFGEGDGEDAKVPQTFARFGVVSVDPRGACKAVDYAREEELLFVREGGGQLQYGDENHAIADSDFAYAPPGVRHGITNPSVAPLRVVVVTAKIPASAPLAQTPGKLEIANLREIREQTVGGHPTSVLYKLMIGPRVTARDRINATYAVADFFLMDFAPGGTNFPHHHETAEEIYLVLDGQGKMSAGSGMDGVEGLHAAKAGDAYYFRTNCTVGFYNQATAGAKAHILAVRAYVPMPKELD